VDFTYEVSRALASCEGALLLVDASQGVEAQTLANLYLALEHNLEIIPVINKIDLPSADIDRVKDQIEEDLGLDPETAILTSAKEGLGIDDIMEAVVNHAAATRRGMPEAPLEALIFDSHYDPFRGTIVHFRVFKGHHQSRGYGFASCPTTPPTRSRRWASSRSSANPKKNCAPARWGT
jgi:GTP-binding protein LepA